MMHTRNLLAAFLVTACSSSGSTSNPAPGDAGSDASDSASGARTLASCATSIAADAPQFFKTYFRCVTITTTADSIVIATQDLPPHATYYYGSGNANYAEFDTRGGDYKPNPNKLAAKDTRVTIPKTPEAKGITVTTAMVDGVVGTSTDEFPMGPAGVALDSVALFNPLARAGDDIAQERFTFDGYDAHPAPDGTYHYHTASRGPLEVLALTSGVTKTTPGSAEIELFGIMCDGTVVLGCTELDGKAPDKSGLDAQGGHVHDLKDKDGTVQLAGRYHAHVCPTDATGRKYTPEIQYYKTCTR